MSLDLGALALRITADPNPVRRTLRQVEGEASQSGRRAGDSFGGGFSRNLKKLAGGAALLVAGAGLKDFLFDAVKQSSNLNETINKSTIIFGSNEASIERWASTSAKSLGLSKGATLDAAAALGDMFHQIGFTSKAAADASVKTVQMAADLGSFNNLDTADVLDRINGAFRGEYDALQKVIPNISAARVQQVAMAESGVKNAASLTAQQKAHAVLTIIQKDGARAMGDFARTSGGLANQQKILNAEILDTKARIGDQLVPVLTVAVHHLSLFLEEMKTGTGTGGEFARTAGVIGHVLIHDVLPPIAGLAKFLGGTFLGSTEGATATLGAFLAVMAARKITIFTDAVATAALKITEAGGTISGAGAKITGFSRRLGSVASFLGGPWGIAIGIGVSALVGWASKQSQAAKETQSFTDSLKFQKGVLDLNSQAMLADKLAKEGSLDAAVAAGIGEKEYAAALVAGGTVRQAMLDQLDQIIVSTQTAAESGQGNTSALLEQNAAARKASDGLLINGAALDRSAHASEIAGSAIAGLSAKQTTTSGTTKTLRVGTDGLTDAQRTLKNAIQGVINKFTVLNGGALSAEQRSQAWQAAIDGVTASVKANGHSLNIHSAAGRANRNAIIDMVTAINDDATATFKSTYQHSKAKTEQGKLNEATKAAKKVVDEGKTSIDKAAHANHLNTGQVHNLTDAMLKVPKKVTVPVTTPGLKGKGGAIESAKELRNRIDNIKNKTVKLSMTFAASATSAAVKFFKTVPGSQASGFVGAFQPHAAGGPIQNLSGRGVKGRDTEHILGAVGEHMWTDKEVDAVGGHQVMYRMRRDARAGKFRGYATGGPISRYLRINTSSNAIPAAVNKFGPAGVAAAGDVGGDAIRSLGALGQKALNALIASSMGGSGGPVAAGGYARALAYARRHVGHPYIFGTLWDCSGFISALHSIILGQQPHRRYSTPAFHGAHAAGFTRGKRSPFMVGVNPAPGKFGHMAGTLNGVNVESAGGVGVRVGRSARGYNAGMFSWRGGLAGGGPVQRGMGDLPFDLLDPHGQRYNPALVEMLRRVGYAGGTRSASAGIRPVAEHGAELVVNPQLKRFRGGERVYDHKDTKRMLGGEWSSSPLIGQVTYNMPASLDPVAAANAAGGLLVAKLSARGIG